MEKEKITPTTRDELRLIIKQKINSNGVNCDLNHIDVSSIMI